ncbi:SHOCT domain-containing protein [Halorubrum aethiopicum]|uniref:SHOCT domain-containing protein n=1 Tax=Halorubrum aethiopicum TaxID=1758255 RepID=UPI000829C353|nr:SHOCT domain-containing protein [Halorubrum aethiopicum]
MTDSSPLERARENATEIASTVVTGVWLVALFLDFGWWLPLMLFGYVVVVPVVSMLFDEEEEETDDATETATETAREDTRARGIDEDGVTGGNADAIDRLRTRYAEGDLTDEQFERKLDKLLETETPEDAAEWRKREQERDRERALDRDRS